MNLGELAQLGQPKQMKKYPNLYSAKHPGQEKLTVLDVDTGDFTTVDTSAEEVLNSMAEVDTFIAEHGLTEAERARVLARKEAGAARMVATEKEAESPWQENEYVDGPVDAGGGRVAMGGLFEDDAIPAIHDSTDIPTINERVPTGDIDTNDIEKEEDAE